MINEDTANTLLDDIPHYLNGGGSQYHERIDWLNTWRDELMTFARIGIKIAMARKSESRSKIEMLSDEAAFLIKD